MSKRLFRRRKMLPVTVATVDALADELDNAVEALGRARAVAKQLDQAGKIAERVCGGNRYEPLAPHLATIQEGVGRFADAMRGVETVKPTEQWGTANHGTAIPD